MLVNQMRPGCIVGFLDRPRYQGEIFYVTNLIIAIIATGRFVDNDKTEQLMYVQYVSYDLLRGLDICDIVIGERSTFLPSDDDIDVLFNPVE